MPDPYSYSLFLFPLLDVDADGKICGITVEHAQRRVEDIPHVSFEQVAV